LTVSTPAAQRADELVRAVFGAVNADDPARTDELLRLQQGKESE
jgi:hypothetical protein